MPCCRRTGAGTTFNVAHALQLLCATLQTDEQHFSTTFQPVQCIPEKWHQTLSCDFHGGSCEGLAGGKTPAPFAPHAVVINLGQVRISHCHCFALVASAFTRHFVCLHRMTTANQRTKIRRLASRYHLICRPPSSGRTTTGCFLQISQQHNLRVWTRRSSS